MADGAFRLQIITPEKVFYDSEITMIIFKSSEGEIGVLKGHIPLTTMLESGIAVIKTSTGEKEAVLHKGFAKIVGDKVTILTDSAEWPEEIDLERAIQAKERAESRLRSKDVNVEYTRAEAALTRSLLRIQLAEKHNNK